ncbi:PhoH family protein [candidate division KSB1 bacterium]|nr:PhoH family protein [candidate division KSB1 bacterium]MBL7095087.1 PhoH family protein [candidate division KSB1 bacterium]
MTKIETKKKISIRGVNQLNLFGLNDNNLKEIERHFNIKIAARGSELTLIGDDAEVKRVEKVFAELITILERNEKLTENDIITVIEVLKSGRTKDNKNTDLNSVIVYTKEGHIKPKTAGQKKYYKSTRENDIVFVIGPAGTGKTYLAVAVALSQLRDKKIDKLVLARPAVEAGESLGFLPGDLREKIDPYLRPLYDALFDMVIPAKLKKYMENGTIEIVPLAYMRGRTLNNAFVILDEAQNTFPNQMKMFLTRLGVNSKAIITGDVTQIDLPDKKQSGLVQIQNILKEIDGIDFVYLSENDVVRHRLVRQIIKAYENYNNNNLLSLAQTDNDETKIELNDSK